MQNNIDCLRTPPISSFLSHLSSLFLYNGLKQDFNPKNKVYAGRNDHLLKKKVSIRDVAQEAGVSVGTVSRVCNRCKVSEDFAVKVRAAMDDGFRPCEYREKIMAHLPKK